MGQIRLPGKKIRRSRSLLAPRRLAIVLGTIAMQLACGVGAQTWPEHPIRLVVPFPAGGAIDIVARLVAQRLAELPGLRNQPVVVENRAGASGSIGSEAVARAHPDGYTLLLGTGSTHGTNAAVIPGLPYDPVTDFAPVILIATAPYLLLVHPSVPVRSLPELIALARSQPGRLHYGSYGPGSSNHLATEKLRALTGLDLVHVPYKGGAPAVVALVGGEVQLMFDVWTSSGPHVRAGRMRLLATAAEHRSGVAPGVPTFAEVGVPGFLAGTYWAVFAPAATPVERIATINRWINRIIDEPAMRQWLLAQGADPMGGPPRVLAAHVRDDVATWRTLVRERRLEVD